MTIRNASLAAVASVLITAGGAFAQDQYDAFIEELLADETVEILSIELVNGETSADDRYAILIRTSEGEVLKCDIAADIGAEASYGSLCRGVADRSFRS